MASVMDRLRKSDALSAFGDELRSSFVQNTGFIGNAIEESILRDQDAAKDKHQAEIIKKQKLTVDTRNKSLLGMTASFIQISRNLQSIADIIGAQITLQEETNEALKQSPSVAQKKKQSSGISDSLERDSEQVGSSLLDLMGTIGAGSLLGRTVSKLSRRVNQRRVARALEKKHKTRLDKAKADVKARQAELDKAKKAKAEADAKAKAEADRKARAGNAAKKAAGETALKRGGVEAAKSAARHPEAIANAARALREAERKAFQIEKKFTKEYIKSVAKRKLGPAAVKAGLKSVPAFGWAVGGVLAAIKLSEGDVGGAVLEAGAAIGGPVTASVALAGIIFNETYGEIYGVYPTQDTAENFKWRAPGVFSIAKEVVGEYLSEKQAEAIEREKQEQQNWKEYTDELVEEYVPEKPAVETAPHQPGTNEYIPIGQPPINTTDLNVPAASASLNPVQQLIVDHEGIRYKPYKDSVGLWTIGVGHLIGTMLPKEYDRTLSHEEVMALFQSDFAKHERYAKRIPGYDQMNDLGKAAMVDLTFNMGPTWYESWPDLQKQLINKQYDAAADNLAGSKWATQVGNRSATIVDMVRNAGTEISVASTKVSNARAKQVASALVNITNVNNNVVVKKEAGRSGAASQTALKVG